MLSHLLQVTQLERGRSRVLNPELKACALAVELWDSLWGCLGTLQGMNVFKLELKSHICPLPSALLLCCPSTPAGGAGGEGWLDTQGVLGT